MPSCDMTARSSHSAVIKHLIFNRGLPLTWCGGMRYIKQETAVLSYCLHTCMALPVQRVSAQPQNPASGRGYRRITCLTSLGNLAAPNKSLAVFIVWKPSLLNQDLVHQLSALHYLTRKYRRTNNEILAQWSTLPRILNCKLTNFSSKVQTINKILCEKWSLLFLCQNLIRVNYRC